MDTLTSFDSLNLPIPVKKALEHSNITIPTEIQAQAIPHALSGRDVIGLAQTGTGKTLAFCLPIVVQMDTNGDNGDCALILTPTREIAIQVTEVLKHLTLKMTGRWHPVLVIGGVGMQPQIDGLKKSPRFIVATPGRLLDHMQEGHANLNNVKFLVMDEADRMLDMGFAPQLKKILIGVPKERQTMLFSATFPNEIAEITHRYLQEPERVEVGPGHSIPIGTVTQETRELVEADKFDTLVNIINEREGTMIVFTRTKYRTEKLARSLDRLGITSGRLHGDRSQSQRQTTLKAFKDGEFRVLVATDIAARGIDVPEVAYVVNYDIPHVPEEYIHRIGRTGRAGATGIAISFLTPEVREEWRAILKLIDPELYAKTPKVANAPKAVKPANPPHGRSKKHPKKLARMDHSEEQSHSQTAAPNDVDDIDNIPQPSLEEQMSRIDRAQARPRYPQRNGPRGGGPQSRGGKPPHRGGGRFGQQKAGGRPQRPGVRPSNRRIDGDDGAGNK
jgi:superfamily II DNA/RNA helicase